MRMRYRYIIPGCIEILTLNNRYVGHISFNHDVRRKGGGVYIRQLNIRTQYHGKGYGTKLMHRVLKLYGDKTIMLDAAPGWNTPKLDQSGLAYLVSFYKQFGFRVKRYVKVKGNARPTYAEMVRKADTK